jgi:hypothetical protein
VRPSYYNVAGEGTASDFNGGGGQNSVNGGFYPASQGQNTQTPFASAGNQQQDGGDAADGGSASGGSGSAASDSGTQHQGSSGSGGASAGEYSKSNEPKDYSRQTKIGKNFFLASNGKILVVMARYQLTLSEYVEVNSFEGISCLRKSLRS